MADKKKVLIVDDDPDLRGGLVILLGQNYEILEAPDGDSGMKILSSAKVNLVLLDVAMPGMSGLEMLKNVREKWPALRVLMLTAQTDLKLAMQALDLGATAYITKPFDFGGLRAEVKRLLDEPSHSKEEQNSEYRPWRVS